MMTRRQALKTAALASAALSNVRLARAQATGGAAAPSGPFTLPPLPYPPDALEPHIDAKTMEIHHDKHHAAYVTNLNKAIAEFPDLAGKKIEDLLKDVHGLPQKIQTAVQNQGGGHYNHTLFWQMMKKGGGGEPKGELASAIAKAFGNFGAFKEQFTGAATKLFGSGWAWLVLFGDKLVVQTTSNQDSPIMSSLPGAEQEEIRKKYGANALKKVPILGIDVWEHAYYLKYQNRRPEYIASWFNVINWDFVSERYAAKI
jgi:Fe-Mn family superoxide dismutase